MSDKLPELISLEQIQNILGYKSKVSTVRWTKGHGLKPIRQRPMMFLLDVFNQKLQEIQSE